MKNIIVAWCNTNEVDFENFVPLFFVGQRNQKLGYSNNIDILFLDGFEKLSQRYKDSLKSLGFNLHNINNLYLEQDKNFPELNQFRDNYRKNTLLKWVIIGKFAAGENIIHYDGDIVFNEDISIIANKLKNKTFVLQGCPAFTSIANQDWFEQYNKNLGLFCKNMQEYCDKALIERAGWQVTFRTRWAGSWFSKIFLHDQDLISHLIHTGQIVQDSVEDISLALQDYIFFENPLFIHMYDDNFPYKYSREKDIDYFSFIRKDGQDIFGKKRVLFWHMQSCFNFYLSKFISRKRFYPFLNLKKLDLNLNCTGFEDNFTKRFGDLFNYRSRLSVYKYFFEKHDFSEILKNKIWWKEGVFE